jgi:hypothetical protein
MDEAGTSQDADDGDDEAGRERPRVDLRAALEEADRAEPPRLADGSLEPAEDRPSRSWAARLLGGRPRDEEESAPPQRPAPPPVDEEDEEADGQDLAAAGVDMTLPTEALDDLRTVMRSFVGRAPSQRLLIARLKKGAATGELKGSYQEGQFLLLVRKAMEDGKLVKVSKRFSSGLRWSEDEATAAAD